MSKIICQNRFSCKMRNGCAYAKAHSAIDYGLCTFNHTAVFVICVSGCEFENSGWCLSEESNYCHEALLFNNGTIGCGKSL